MNQSRVLRNIALAMAVLFSQGADADVNALVSRLFTRISGVPLGFEDPRRAQMAGLVEQGKLEEAAQIATDDDNFVRSRVQRWVAGWSSVEQDPLAELNDMTAMIVGSVRDERDFREILNGNYGYRFAPDLCDTAPQAGDSDNTVRNRNRNRFPRQDRNDHFRRAQERNLDMADPEAFLRHEGRTSFYSQEAQFEDQLPLIPDTQSAGVLTSRAWMNAHVTAGTNRRPIKFSMLIFMCQEIDSLRDKNLADNFVGPDVDRRPAGSSAVYQGKCRSCHAAIDSARRAFTFLDFNGRELYGNSVQSKLFRGSDTYEEGFFPIDDNWKVLWTPDNNPRFASLGWRTATQGRGINEFGNLLANSKGFSRCMSQRVLDAVCDGSHNIKDLDATLELLAGHFEQNGYVVKRLFEKAATLEACLGR